MKRGKIDQYNCNHIFRHVEYILETDLKLSKCVRCGCLKIAKYKLIKEKILFESDFLKENK
jgi:hypothetical protein